MTRKPEALQCPRSWEIEAAADGRLLGHDVESLRRHLQGCAVCDAEQARFNELRSDLQRLPAPPVNDIAVRRVRQGVLTTHNAWLMRRGDGAKSRRPGYVVVGFVGVAVLALVAWGFLAQWQMSDNGRVTAEGPTVDVSASIGAQWQRRGTLHDVRIVLDDGQLHLRIHRDSAVDRVRIATPDGEIEDLGTVLDVSVANGHTQGVAVTQGSVVLRLESGSSHTIFAGQAWHRAPTAAPDPKAASPHEGPSATQHAPSPATVPTRRQAPERRTDEANGAVSPTASEPSASTSATSRASIAAERAEDDAYLHIVALVGKGEAEQARSAARDYLLRFPNGFRRVEVLNIATRAGH